VPAPAVIPAPRVYTKAVAVKTLVVEFQHPVKSLGQIRIESGRGNLLWFDYLASDSGEGETP
jgi:hypothetical protein